MPIIYRDSPEGGRQIISDKLCELLHTPELILHFLGTHDPESITVSEPHKVYVVRLDDLCDGKLLKAAKHVAWRYLLLAEAEGVAAVELSTEQEFVELNVGPFVRATLEALDSIDEIAEVAEGDYELRLIKIPSVYAMLVWLHGERDILIPITEGHERIKRLASETEDDVIAELQVVAERTVKASN